LVYAIRELCSCCWLSRSKRDRCGLAHLDLDQRDGEENRHQDAVRRNATGRWNRKSGAISQQVLHSGTPAHGPQAKAHLDVD